MIAAVVCILLAIAFAISQLTIQVYKDELKQANSNIEKWRTAAMISHKYYEETSAYAVSLAEHNLELARSVDWMTSTGLFSDPYFSGGYRLHVLPALQIQIDVPHHIKEEIFQRNQNGTRK